MRANGIFVRVVDVLQEIERVRFLIQNSNIGNTVQSIFHVVLCSSLILQAFYFKSFWNAKISTTKKWQLHTAKLTWQRKRRIFIGGTFGKNYNEGKDIKVTQELQEFQIHKQLTEGKKNVSNTGKWGGGRGGTPKNSWWGCAAQFSKSWPYYRPKHVIFHTRFQTWPLKSMPVFRPGGGQKTQNTCFQRSRQKLYNNI